MKLKYKNNGNLAIVEENGSRRGIVLVDVDFSIPVDVY